jgi:hypothetical protein
MQPNRPRRRQSLVNPKLAAFALAPMLVLAACGGHDSASPGTALPGFEGPLHVARADAVHPRAGAAGNVVDCETWGSGGLEDAAVYSEGATARTPEGALRIARSEGDFGGAQDGLTEAKREDDRVLYVLEVGGKIKQAVIVHNGPATTGAGGPGWYVESWAHCDYSELPESFTDSIGLQIWRDRAGQPVPTTELEVWRGPEHCDWQSMTFLLLDDAVYVREPLKELSDYFAERYVEHATLPASATNTGFERDRKHLWISADKKRAYAGTVGDVEVWPRTIKPLGCD